VSDMIEVRGIAADGRHGIMADGERDKPQPFLIDVELELNVKAVAKLDRLDTTVDYQWIVRIVKRVVEENSYELLETLAHTLATEVLAYGGEVVRVRVSKPHAAVSLGVDEIAVSVERSRDPE